MPSIPEDPLPSPEPGEPRSLQKAVLRLVGLKFLDVPVSVVRQIGETQDVAQLEAWIHRLLDAESLAEMGFAEPGDGAGADPVP